MKILFAVLSVFLTYGSHAQKILWDSTFIVDQIEFKVLACRTDSGSFAQIIKSKKDTLTIDGVSGSIRVLRFNNDNFLDLIFSYIGNNYTADLFLYDSESKSYRQVDGFMEVSDAKKLTSNSNYYYSYRRAGCADANWISCLFYIDNYKVLLIGEIYGVGCPLEGNKRRIEISKLASLGKAIQVETLPIDTIESYSKGKWGFIRYYWNDNFEKFKNISSP